MKITKSSIKRFILINVALVIMAYAVMMFLEPPKLAAGGVMGLAIVIQRFIPSLDIGMLMLAFNIVLFGLAFLLIGPHFGGYTIYCSLALSVIISFIERTSNFGVQFGGDLFLNMTVGILIQGIGMAMVFQQNASTGGTDVVAKIINKYTNIEIGKSLFIVDALITIGAAYTFGPTVGAYSFLGVLINGVVIDNVIAGMTTKAHVLIISHDPERIVKYIYETLGRGATYINSKGSFTLKEQRMVSVVLSKRQYLRLRTFIKQHDPTAFLNMHYVHEVLGHGFSAE